MSGYQALRYWCPVMGCDAVRLSMADPAGGEYWTSIPVAGARRYREARDAALDAIEDAITRGDGPGQVEAVA